MRDTNALVETSGNTNIAQVRTDLAGVLLHAVVETAGIVE